MTQNCKVCFKLSDMKVEWCGRLPKVIQWLKHTTSCATLARTFGEIGFVNVRARKGCLVVGRKCLPSHVGPFGPLMTQSRRSGWNHFYYAWDTNQLINRYRGISQRRGHHRWIGLLGDAEAWRFQVHHSDRREGNVVSSILAEAVDVEDC